MTLATENRITLDTEIILDHDRSVSSSAINQIFEILNTVNRHSSYNFLNSDFFHDFELTDKQIQQAKEIVDELVQDTFWLNSVEPGSSKFTGAIIGAVFSAIGIVTGNIASDILHESQSYQDFVKKSAEHFDNFSNLFVYNLNHYNEEREEDDFWIQAEHVGDRLRIYVRPSHRQTNIERMI